MNDDVRSFPVDCAPVGGELEKLRAEFVQFQFRFHPFSDHHTVVARFAWEKVQEAIAAIADQSPKGGDPQGLHAKHASGGARSAIAQPPDPQSSDQP